MKLEELNLDTLTLNKLAAHGITTLRELLMYSENELLELNNIGKTKINDIKTKLKNTGYELPKRKKIEQVIEEIKQGKINEIFISDIKLDAYKKKLLTDKKIFKLNQLYVLSTTEFEQMYGEQNNYSDLETLIKKIKNKFNKQEQSDILKQILKDIELKDISISVLNLDKRIEENLKNCGILNLEQLVNQPKNCVMGFKKIGSDGYHKYVNTINSLKLESKKEPSNDYNVEIQELLEERNNKLNYIIELEKQINEIDEKIKKINKYKEKEDKQKIKVN